LLQGATLVLRRELGEHVVERLNLQKI
jgi:hypothetical protein